MPNNQLCQLFFLWKVENKSFPVCFPNEVGKDPIIQFEDKLPEHSKQDWWKTMEQQRASSDVMMCTFFHITFRTSTAEALIHACSCGNIAVAPVLLRPVNVAQNLTRGMDSHKFTQRVAHQLPLFILACVCRQVLPYWGNPHDRKVIRKFWSQVRRT